MVFRRAHSYRYLHASARHSSSGSRPLSEVPGPAQLPFIGTILDFIKRSDGKIDQPDIIAIHTSYYREFGDIYRLNMPPFGDHVVVCDPREYLKIFQMEGRYPPGASQLAWPFMHYHESKGNEAIKKIMLDGEPWHEYRHQLAKDIFSPAAAKSYLPAVNEAARLASSAALDYEDRFDEFSSRIAFDMFCALAIGKQPQTTNEKHAEHADLEFVQDSMQGFTLAGQLMLEPHRKWFGGSKLRRFMKHMSSAQKKGEKIVETLWDNVDSDEAPGSAGSSYMSRLARRGQLSKADMSETLMALLMAGVDTTSHVTAWLWLNLAQHPSKQEALRRELAYVLCGGDFTAEALGKLPYLKACIRESHRYTPPGPFGGIRKLPKTASFCGYEIPEGTQVILNQVAFQTDSKYLGESCEFKPERWLPEEVARRSKEGEHAAVLDHRLLSAPFGFGARMCLGARVASLEIQAATCRLVQDYHFEVLPDQSWSLKQGLFVKADPFPKLKLTKL